MTTSADNMEDIIVSENLRFHYTNEYDEKAAVTEVLKGINISIKKEALQRFSDTTARENQRLQSILTEYLCQAPERFSCAESIPRTKTDSLN